MNTVEIYQMPERPPRTEFMLVGSQNVPSAPIYTRLREVSLVESTETFHLDGIINPPVQPSIQTIEGINITSMAGDTVWGGLENPTLPKVIWLVNSSDYSLTLTHERTATEPVETSADDRFAMQGNADHVILANSIVRLVWFGGNNRWMIVS